MSQIKLDSISIWNYRSLENLNVQTLGRLNLITGQNNIGKTSLLEAVRLWSSRIDISALLDIIDARDESLLPDKELKDERDERQGDNSLLGCLCLFSGYPSLDTNIEPIRIAGSGTTLSISVRDKEVGQTSFPEIKQDLSELITGTRVLELGIQPLNRSVAIRLPTYYSSSRRNSYRDLRVRENQEGIPCVFVAARTIETFNAATLWDNITLTDKEEFVLQGIQIVEPRVSRINFIQWGRRGRFPVVRVEGIERPIPLHGLGDGVSRLFEIMLALVNAESGFLLIDEFENGLHYSIQETAWETILNLANKLDVQVFATTHSSDCVEAFESVSRANPDTAMVVTRLLMEDSGVFAESVSGEKLSKRVELGREIR